MSRSLNTSGLNNNNKKKSIRSIYVLAENSWVGVFQLSDGALGRFSKIQILIKTILTCRYTFNMANKYGSRRDFLKTIYASSRAIFPSPQSTGQGLSIKRKWMRSM